MDNHMHMFIKVPPHSSCISWRLLLNLTRVTWYMLLLSRTFHFDLVDPQTMQLPIHLIEEH